MCIWIQFRKPNSEIWFCAAIELCHLCSCSRQVQLGTVWFTALCTLYDVKLCSLCAQNKQLFFSESCTRLGCYPASSGNSLPTVQDNTWSLIVVSRWDQTVVPNHQHGITTAQCVITQRLTVLIYSTVESYNYMPVVVIATVWCQLQFISQNISL